MKKQYRPRVDEKLYNYIKEYKNKGNVGIIGDTHLPFEHKDYLDFCYETFDRFAVSKIIHIGDLVDGHAWSYHESSPNGYAALKEAEIAQKKVDKWTATFPNVTMMLGNHDLLVARKMQTAGLPTKFLKEFADMWNLPKGWDVVFDYELDDVYYFHGTGSSGQYAAFNRAKEMRQSVVMGHVHHSAHVIYSSNLRGDTIFGMNVGCGIDKDAYAFEYGRGFAKKPNLGCGIVTNQGKQGFYIPMI